MDGVDAGRPAAETMNPFSPTAVARVMDFDSEITVETDTIRDALDVVREYLGTDRTSGDGPPEGKVLAVVGDYGTGKTHLTMQVLRYLTERDDPAVRCTYLDATADSFTALYRRFLTKLEQEHDVRARVRRYYAHIVADALPGSPLRDELAQRLRTDAKLDPGFVVEQFGLSESTLQRRLQQRLASVTDNQEYGVALGLLLRPGLDEVVWGWLEGKPPEPVLRERGVTTTIDTDVAALAAMGVITLLFSGDDSRFVLVIDELDKVLSARSSPGTNALAAFKQLLHAFIGSGSLLVLSCLPDVLPTLGKDAFDRIGDVLKMGRLTVRDTTRLIEATQQAAFGEARLAPFTPETVEHLVRLGEGNARQIIRLCHDTYRRHLDTGAPITLELVQDAAEERFRLVSLSDVRDVVAGVLDANGWPYQRDHLVGDRPESRVDFWIVPAGSGAGAAVLVVESVFNSDQVDTLHRSAIAIRDGASDAEALLVVNGLLAAEAETELAGSFGVAPLTYSTHSFVPNLTATLRTMVNRLQAFTGEDSYRVVRERVEWINQQQSNTHTYIEQVGRHVDALRSATDRQLIALQREVAELTATVRAGDPPPGAAPLPPATPAEVEALFAEALDALDEFNRFDAVLREAFGSGPDAGAGPAGVRDAIRANLRFEDTARAAGTAVLLQKIVHGFQDGIRDWFRAYQSAGQRVLTPAFRDSLDRLCGTYDAISEFLPTFHLAAVDRLMSEGVVADGEDTPDLVVRTARRDYHGRVAEVLQDLSARVRGAVLRLAGGRS